MRHYIAYKKSGAKIIGFLLTTKLITNYFARRFVQSQACLRYAGAGDYSPIFTKANPAVLRVGRTSPRSAPLVGARNQIPVRDLSP